MSNDTHLAAPSIPAAFGADCLQSVMDCQRTIGQSMLLAQREQRELLAAWQHPIGAVQPGLTDQWISRFGGGVPLDG